MRTPTPTRRRASRRGPHNPRRFVLPGMMMVFLCALGLVARPYLATPDERELAEAQPVPAAPRNGPMPSPQPEAEPVEAPPQPQPEPVEAPPQPERVEERGLPPSGKPAVANSRSNTTLAPKTIRMFPPLPGGRIKWGNYDLPVVPATWRNVRIYRTRMAEFYDEFDRAARCYSKRQRLGQAGRFIFQCDKQIGFDGVKVPDSYVKWTKLFMKVIRIRAESMYYEAGIPEMKFLERQKYSDLHSRAVKLLEDLTRNPIGTKAGASVRKVDSPKPVAPESLRKRREERERKRQKEEERKALSWTSGKVDVLNRLIDRLPNPKNLRRVKLRRLSKRADELARENGNRRSGRSYKRMVNAAGDLLAAYNRLAPKGKRKTVRDL